MKLVIFAIINSVFACANALVTSVDQGTQSVNWTPVNSLMVNSTVAEQDDQNYAFLSIIWNLDAAAVAEDYRAVQKQYPSYKIIRNDIQSIDRLIFSIPAAGINLTMNFTMSANGPMINDNETLNRDSYEKLQAAQQAAPLSFALVSGTAHISETVTFVDETATVAPELCESLLGNQKLSGVANNIEQYANQLNQAQTPKLAQTKEQILATIKSSCFEVATASVSSFEKLMNAPVKVVLTEPVLIQITHVGQQSKTFSLQSQMAPWSPK
jgi:hypothetical protein